MLCAVCACDACVVYVVCGMWYVCVCVCVVCVCVRVSRVRARAPRWGCAPSDTGIERESERECEPGRGAALSGVSGSAA